MTDKKDFVYTNVQKLDKTEKNLEKKVNAFSFQFSRSTGGSKILS